MNPLIPSGADIAWLVAVVVNLVLVVAALVSLARTGDKRHWLTLVLAILLLPYLGPIVSLRITRSRRTSSSADGDHGAQSAT